MKASGLRNDEIAANLGYEPAYVSRILADPRAEAKVQEFRERVAESMVDVGLKIKALAGEALDTAAFWMRQRDRRLAATSVKSAFGILDRAGYTKVEKRLVGHFNATPEHMEQMERLARTANEVREEYDYGAEGGGDGDGREPSTP